MLTRVIGVFLLLSINLFSLFWWAIFLIPSLLRKMFTSLRTRNLKRVLHTTQNYEEWLRTAYVLDKEAGALDWRSDPSSYHYDYKYIQKIVAFMEEFIRSGEVAKLVPLTRSILMRNFSGINNQMLYNHCFSGTKLLVDHFHETVERALDAIYASDFPQKYEFFTEIRHFLGRSCLMLSGGASFGMFHIGVISTLVKFDLLPKIICGSSAGSLIAAFVATRTTDELRRLDQSDYKDLDFGPFERISKNFSLVRKLRRLFRDGHMIDKGPLSEFAKANTFNLTFREAFEKTRVVLNITVTDSHHQKFRLLNYLSAPNVLVWSAAMASCSFPVVYAPTRILAKTRDATGEWMPDDKYFIDGSFGADLPMKSVATLFNVTNFIVSQVNLHTLPFTHRSYYHINSIKYVVYRASELLAGFVISEIIHRARQLQSLFSLPSFVQFAVNIILQEYFGNVNITPSFDFVDVLFIFSNPSREELLKWARRGRNRSFFHLRQIQDFVQVERKLEHVIHQLRLKRDAGKGESPRDVDERRLGDREPSHMKQIDGI